VADEAFEELWSRKGGPDLVALQSVFEGQALVSEEVRQVVGLTMEQLREALVAAQRVGLVSVSEERIVFVPIPPASGQRARLDWCLEAHQKEFVALKGALQTKFMVRFLSSNIRSV